MKTSGNIVTDVRRLQIRKCHTSVYAHMSIVVSGLYTDDRPVTRNCLRECRVYRIMSENNLLLLHDKSL